MNENKHPLQDFMETSIGKIRELADSNAIVGQPITTPDGVTLIPISRVNFGFSSGGTDYGKTAPTKFAGGAGGAVKIEPVAFLVVKNGVTTVMPVAIPAMSTADRVLEMIPQLMDRVEGYVEKKKEKEEP